MRVRVAVCVASGPRTEPSTAMEPRYSPLTLTNTAPGFLLSTPASDRASTSVACTPRNLTLGTFRPPPRAAVRNAAMADTFCLTGSGLGAATTTTAACWHSETTACVTPEMPRSQLTRWPMETTPLQVLQVEVNFDVISMYL